MPRVRHCVIGNETVHDATASDVSFSVHVQHNGRMSKSFLHYSDRKVDSVDKHALITETGITVCESVFFSSERNMMKIHPLTGWEA